MSPSPTQSQRLQNRGSAQHRPRPPRPGSGTRSPRTLDLPHPSMHTRREPAKESYPPRPRDEDRRSVRGSAAPAELRSVRRCRSPQAGCCPFRGACSIRQPTPAAGGNRSKVAPVRGGLGMIRAPPPQTWPGSREGCTAALSPRRPPARRFPPH